MRAPPPRGHAPVQDRISLIWVKTSSSRWCKLVEVNLALVRTYGVYVIWHGGYPSRVVKVGHGDIATELAACREDPRVMSYAKEGALFVTWAAVAASSAAGVDLHLADSLRPLIEEPAALNVAAIAANSPF